MNTLPQTFISVMSDSVKTISIITGSLLYFYSLDGQVPVKKLYVRSLIPKSPNFMTYEGSLTYPGCYETVTWIIMNRPIFVSNDQVIDIKGVYVVTMISYYMGSI